MPQFSTENSNASECPYCGIRFSIDGVDAYHSPLRFEGTRTAMYGRAARREGEPEFTISCHRCPECLGQIVWLNELSRPDDPGRSWDVQIVATTLLYPKAAKRALPAATPDDISADFQEAYQVLGFSPKASAALSRRCLQNLIRSQESIEDKTLFAEVNRLLALNKLPRYLAEDLDPIRITGNLAAHPTIDTTTGQIVEVEPEEARWVLEVLEDLICFYFEQQPRSRVRRERLDSKLRGAERTGHKS